MGNKKIVIKLKRTKKYQCDCCGKMSINIKRGWAYGLETDACATCRKGNKNT